MIHTKLLVPFDLEILLLINPKKIIIFKRAGKIKFFLKGQEFSYTYIHCNFVYNSKKSVNCYVPRLEYSGYCK